ncbi:MAG: DUF2298 domain-containing protein [Candidatus Daviesbacteria bacterium]|nr:DUF2298 domain-containing protein [Candidatus Daviesbacteria bacterium]
MQDFIYIFTWWGMFFGIGVIFLPLTSLIFSNFIDRGYIFSKILGMLFVSYVIWILASIRLIPFSTTNIFVLLTLFGLLNIFLFRKFKLINQLKLNWKIFLFEEILFTFGLILWSYVKAHEPSIHGLEKFMDFGFINSIIRSEYFPPKDIWMSQTTINYYYFGHLYTAVLTKLSFLNPAITFNLMLASLCGFSLSAFFSIGANIYSHFSKNIKQIFLAGILAGFLVTFTGNLHTVYVFFENYKVENPAPFWLLKPELNLAYWYPNATRFIPFTIHEFPLYSFVVSDLHGHVLDIPVVFLIIALLIYIFYLNENTPSRLKFLYYPLLGLFIAIASITNILDGPIYLMLSGLILLFKEKKRFIIPFLTVISAMGIFSLPFWLNFKSFSSGIGILCAPQFLTNLGKLGPFIFEVDHCQRSPYWMLLIIYGFFLIVFFSYLLILKYSAKKGFDITEKLMIIFMIFAGLTLIIPELIYFKDIYPAHYRANTIFKFGYQLFIVSSLAASFMILRIITFRKSLSLKYFCLPLLLVAFCLISIYPYFAIKTYFNDLKNYSGLNGLAYLKQLYFEDYEAILWINQNIKNQPIILEAVGESYSDFARVSSNTGLPTVIGWPVHEWLWRNSLKDVDPRKIDVDLLYKSADLEITKNLIKRYLITYIFIGALEKQKYPDLNEDKFSKLGKQIYINGSTSIYQISF